MGLEGPLIAGKFDRAKESIRISWHKLTLRDLWILKDCGRIGYLNEDWKVKAEIDWWKREWNTGITKIINRIDYNSNGVELKKWFHIKLNRILVFLSRKSFIPEKKGYFQFSRGEFWKINRVLAKIYYKLDAADLINYLSY